jgi:hypothetical protein
MSFVRCGGLLAALGFLTFVPLSQAGDWKPEPGYKSLFNHKDLSGWRYYKETDLSGKTATADKRFTVEDGAIVANLGGGIKDLFTVEEFPKNFNLKMEFRAGLKADSGVYLRSAGAQLQVRDYIRRGERKSLKKFKDDDWNELDITVEGNKSACVVNGKNLSAKDTLELFFRAGVPTAMVNGKSEPVNKIEVSTFAEAKCLCNGEFLETMKIPSTGPIGVQAETGKFEFRHIRIKNLD